MSDVHIGAYVLLYLGVAASWIGIPIIGASMLATAGVLASNGELNIWMVIAVASLASWTGGYVGWWLGVRASDNVLHPNLNSRQKRAVATAERVYRRWGRLAVFVTPTWVSGALRMPRRTFLVWNAAAAIVSTCIAVLGAYGIGAAVIGELKKRRGGLALFVALLALAAAIVAYKRYRDARS